MENQQLRKEVEELKELAKHYEDGLKSLGLSIAYQPDEVREMLNDCIDFQQAFNLPSINVRLLQTLFMIKRSEQLENKLAASNLEGEIKLQEEQIKQLKSECALLKSFIAKVNSRRMEREKVKSEELLTDLEQQSRNLDEQAKKVQNDYYESVIAKLEQLELPESPVAEQPKRK